MAAIGGKTVGGTGRPASAKLCWRASSARRSSSMISTFSARRPRWCSARCSSPSRRRQTQTLNAYLTFGLAFLARPVGSFLFGHFGDRIGRKSTLVATMLTMGVATTLIGALPGYATAGVLAPWLLALLRFVQGVGLGGEWGGAALIAVENAPEGRRAWFGMFPQLGPPLGFFIATGLFLFLLVGLRRNRPSSTGRGAFPFSSAPSWSRSASMCGCRSRRRRRSARRSRKFAGRRAARSGARGVIGCPLIQGSLSIVVCYALFYIATVYALGYGVRALGIPRIALSRDALPSRLCSWRRRRRFPRLSPTASAGGRC